MLCYLRIKTEKIIIINPASMEYMWKIIVVLDLFRFLSVPPSSFICNVPVLSLQISFLRISERGSTSCKVT